jgi:hypothetical protein
MNPLRATLWPRNRQSKIGSAGSKRAHRCHWCGMIQDEGRGRAKRIKGIGSRNFGNQQTTVKRGRKQ